MNPKRINDVIPEWLTGGIFSALDNFDVPWKELGIADELDLQYHGNYSGQKIISPLVKTLLVDGELTSGNMELLGATIFTMFGDNWVKQWETLIVEYNPIENYRMVENMTDDVKTTDYGRTSTRTDNLTNNIDNSTYAFNSSSAVPTDEVESRNTGTQGVTDGGRDTETRNYELTRSGNIGITTSQQMIESERKLRMWNFFEMVVFPDVDRVLTIKIY